MTGPALPRPSAPPFPGRRAPVRRGTAALLAGALALVVTACTAGSGSSGSSDAGDRKSLAVGFVAEPATLDFTRNDGANIPQALLVNVYEGLVKLDPEGEIVPLLAESWEVSGDRRTYTFQLRGATFTNGKPFTAADVVFSINRVKTDWAISLKAGMDVVASVAAPDPRTAVVTLKRPSNSWLFAMTSRIGAMFSEDGVADLANTPVGTGPYVLEDRKRGDSITLAANDDYWGEKPPLTEVVLRYYKDATALNNALLTGGIDVISTVQAPESLGQFDDPDRFQVVEGTTTGEVVLSFNNGRAPLDDVRVRRAVNHAIDRKALLATAWAGRGQLIGSMVPLTDPWYEDLSQTYPYDPAKARQLLAAAGKPTLRLAFKIPNLPYALSTAQVVKSQLAQVGITADIQPLDFPAVWLSEVFTKADYDMSIINHVEPRDIASWGNPKYYWRYDNPTVRRLLASADEGSEQQQVADLKQVARTLATDAAASWLFLFPNLMVAEKGVQGLPQNLVSESFDLTALSRG